MKTKTFKLIMTLAFSIIFLMGTLMVKTPQLYVFADQGEEVTDTGKVPVDDTQILASVSKPYESDLQAESKSINDTNAELEEINRILKSTSRKIAMLEDDQKGNPAEQKLVQSNRVISVSSPSGLSPRASDKISTFDDDIRKQTMEDILSHQEIRKGFEDAKNVKLPVGTPDAFRPDEAIKYQTQTEIIRSVISPELLSKKIDLDFDETALGDIILTVSKLANINIVLDPNMKNNKFDLHLNQVTIQEALLLIADSFKLGFKRVGDSLYATLQTELLQQSQTSKVFRLKNINVSEAKELLGNMGKKIDVSQDLNSLVAVGQPEEIEKMEKAINKLDNPQPQVVLEAKIIEITRDGLEKIGVDWSDTITMSAQEAGRPSTFSTTENAPGNLMKIYSFARNPIQFDAVINMLENQNKAKVLSNPRVSTINGKESQIFVGDRIPYTVTNVTGGVATTDVRWVEPGIRLIITPSIIGDDFVVIKVQPEVSFIFAFRGPNSEFPHIKTREATAYVRIKNNEPFILGGLLSQEDKKSLYKVPLLGNIPWLGNLFSYQSTTTSDVELIISITPTIVYGNLN